MRVKTYPCPQKASSEFKGEHEKGKKKIYLGRVVIKTKLCALPKCKFRIIFPSDNSLYFSLIFFLWDAGRLHQHRQFCSWDGFCWHLWLDPMLTKGNTMLPVDFSEFESRKLKCSNSVFILLVSSEGRCLKPPFIQKV